MTNYKRRRAIQSIKALIIWLVAITANIAFIYAAIDALWTSWPILCGFIIVVVTWSLVVQIDEITQDIMKLKKSHRCCNTRKGH